VGDRTADDLLDAVGRDAGAAEELAIGLAQEVGGMGVRTASTITGSAAMGAGPLREATRN
jgi:hypothetical protein